SADRGRGAKGERSEPRRHVSPESIRQRSVCTDRVRRDACRQQAALALAPLPPRRAHPFPRCVSTVAPSERDGSRIVPTRLPIIMSIKSEADWRGLRRAADVARETLDALEAHVRAGITTGELDVVAAVIFKKRGARSAPALVYGFPGTVLISVNDEIVHGVPGKRELRAGDLVK